MLFNSVGFLLFLPVVFIFYWFVFNKKYQYQNILLLLASFFFYGCWDWRFLLLLLFSIGLDFVSGLKIEKSKTKRESKFWLILSITINLGFLGFFKYYNFFVESFADLLHRAGFYPNIWMLNVILPVGISFYTFHGLSYVIDIYKKRIAAEKNFIDYAVFVSYFPLLVAGPIERATHLLPQIQKKRIFSYDQAIDGMRQILWGFLKKMVIADNCAPIVNDIFTNYQTESSSNLVMGVILFAFQIYGDFSGYSDIALGVSRLFGIELLKNFAFPYFSRDIAEFWRRWHISLSSWFRDYVYIPLGGSKGGMWMKIRNTFIIFLLSGFWHGANWTFIIWGGLNAIYFLPLLVTNKNRHNLEVVALNRSLPSVKEIINIFLTFLLVCFAWIFFRAESVSQALQYIKNIFSNTLFSLPNPFPFKILCFIILMIFIEWINRQKFHGLEISNYNRWVRRIIYLIIIFIILRYANFGSKEFIYFQF
ncbi:MULTISPECIES: MBOAT family O-acyltransferase [Chryseobacterium]|uniref:D-alanyl-lipoteichoic acid acyltransferase DltB (MBOAT superfamily) n=1 Tax=Chryseobacterium geocarposphaerae TaxID=1416776 RepID=A0ABU1LI34_9FLAO|nr:MULTISPECIES: MBOAT family O-acyltransferase [Chryseobacterium]MDR6406375.1 D-alanyl-lipoteichoic acid acyltransferase DltB (MBOAT superfamily) [Chryseobacterium geocarposphaerae]MDR6699186.1 D-alanyl-lipoteichoic acid acyltransferase DltB (MBOAT superfamily) [Chryseobacterium ginsenosidimutans]